MLQNSKWMLGCLVVQLVPVLVDWTHSLCKATELSVLLMMRKFYLLLPLGFMLKLIHSRRVDLANERLPEFDPQRPTMYPVPSMRMATRRSSDGVDMEELIKRTLEEEGGEGSAVELLAERIARGRSVTSRPSGLKRHGTAI